MRHFKLFFAAFVLMLSTSTFANSFDDKSKKGSMSYEIERMLQDSRLIIEEDFTVKVIFKVTEDRTIKVHSVTSPNEKVNEFLQTRLNNQKLNGQGWFTEKYYELPVKVQAKK